MKINKIFVLSIFCIVVGADIMMYPVYRQNSFMFSAHDQAGRRFVFGDLKQLHSLREKESIQKFRGETVIQSQSHTIQVRLWRRTLVREKDGSLVPSMRPDQPDFVLKLRGILILVDPGLYELGLYPPGASEPVDHVIVLIQPYPEKMSPPKPKRRTKPRFDTPTPLVYQSPGDFSLYVSNFLTTRGVLFLPKTYFEIKVSEHPSPKPRLGGGSGLVSERQRGAEPLRGRGGGRARGSREPPGGEGEGPGRPRVPGTREPPVR